mmetsp:Transcript_42123/g.70288  ORF Transcript_42123/g.70288 Transcript_42123/m.70288 type:complete len:222 (-) Transcript_42123:136-801(-)
MASSRVGEITRVPTPLRGTIRARYISSTLGIKKAKVFPDPVRAAPSKSLPDSNVGMDLACTSVMNVNFISLIALDEGSHSSNEANSFELITLSSAVSNPSPMSKSSLCFFAFFILEISALAPPVSSGSASSSCSASAEASSSDVLSVASGSSIFVFFFFFFSTLFGVTTGSSCASSFFRFLSLLLASSTAPPNAWCMALPPCFFFFSFNFFFCALAGDDIA